MRVYLIAAQSLDGFITQHDKPGSGFTSDADKEHFSRILADFDCQIMGSTTYRVAREKILPRRGLPRLRLVLTRDPAAYAGDAVPGALEFTNEPVASLVEKQRARGCRSCAVLGGSQLYSAFLSANLVDEIWLTVEPLLFGSGTRLLARPGDYQLKLLSSEKLAADTLLLKYLVVRPT
jgi:dihydrofolate reductase